MKPKSDWPKWLFIITLALAMGAGFLSFRYYQSQQRIQQQAQLLVELRSEYQKRVDELRNKLVVSKTITVKIPTPTIVQECRPGPLGINMCLPVTKMVEREVQQVVSAEDPNVRAELDKALADLKRLSDENIKYSNSQATLSSIYEFSQNIMKPIISIVVLIASLFIVLSKRYNSEEQKWAFGSLGTIIGIWLK